MCDSSPNSDDDRRGWSRDLGSLLHVGTMFPVAIGLGTVGGWWLDGRLGTSPWLTLTGFALGVATALRNLIRSVRQLEKMDQPPDIPVPPPTEPENDRRTDRLP